MCFFKSLLFLRLLSPHLILENLDSRLHVPEFVQFICAGEGSSLILYLRGRSWRRGISRISNHSVCMGALSLSHVARSPPGSSVHWISPARILEWVATFSSRGSSPPRDQTCVPYISCIGRWILYHRAIWEASQS